MPAFYDFFRKIKLMPNNVNIEADSTTDTATFVAGTNLEFVVDDAVISAPNTTDQVTIEAADFSTYVPLGTTKLRLEKDLNGTVSTSSEIEVIPDPVSSITVTRISDTQLQIGSTAPVLPFSQEQIEDFSAGLLTAGTHTDITTTYVDVSALTSGSINIANTSTLETVTGRGASSTNAITISNATGSSDTTTGALKLTAGGLAVFENINAGGYVSGNTLTSTVATGTAPLTVTSTTVVANLQAATSAKWHTARTVTFSGGDVTGSFSIDGSGDVSGVALTVASDTVALGTDTTGNYVATGATSGNGLSGSTSSEGATFTVSSNATALNTAETIVFRDASGDFAAGTISATFSGAHNGTVGATTPTTGAFTTVSASSTATIGASAIEAVSVSPSALTGAVTLDAKSNSVYFYTANASGNWTLNFRGDGSTTMNSFLAIGQSVTVALLATQGATAYYPTSFSVDGSAVTPKWLGGSAPSGGNASGVDSYSFTIVKTAASTYTVLASQARFA